MNNIHPLFPTEEAENRFDEFWQWCLEKKGKMIARTIYNEIVSPSGRHSRALDRESGEYVTLHLKATEDELIDGMKRYAREKMGPDFVRSKYIQQPSRWLGRGGWEDE